MTATFHFQPEFQFISTFYLYADSRRWGGKTSDASNYSYNYHQWFDPIFANGK